MLLILICNKINYSYIATELWHYDLFVLICQLANQKVFGFFFCQNKFQYLVMLIYIQKCIYNSQTFGLQK
jgi:hypothetical protein